MRRYKILDSLGETIGYVEGAWNHRQALEKAWAKYPFNKPTVKPIKWG